MPAPVWNQNKAGDVYALLKREVILMTRLWQAALMACAATAIYMQPGHAADVSGATSIETGTTSVEMQGLTDVDVAIGRGDVPNTPSFGLRLFTQPVTGTVGREGLGNSERIAVRRELSFLDEADDGELIDVVAAVRNDPGYDAEGDNAGEAVNSWTGMLDSEEATNALAPPRVKQAPRDAAGRSPSGMGSQIIP